MKTTIARIGNLTLCLFQVRLCKKDRPPLQRAQAAETLAYLTEVDIELQRTASISNHLILTLSELLKYQPRIGSKTPMITVEQEIKISTEMRQAAFRVSGAALIFSLQMGQTYLHFTITTGLL